MKRDSVVSCLLPDNYKLLKSTFHANTVYPVDLPNNVHHKVTACLNGRQMSADGRALLMGPRTAPLT